MSNNQLVENLLRPPVELYSAISYGLLALLSVMAPSYFMMTPVVAATCAAGLFMLSVKRFIQGFKILRYQHGLKRISPYILKDKNIPVSNLKLFLGRGFLWDQRHAQRLADLNRKDGREYKEHSKIFLWARSFELKHEKHAWFAFYLKVYQSFINFLERFKWFLPFRLLKWVLLNLPVANLPPVGGEPSLHAVGLYEGERPIAMNIADRVGHTLVLGTTRVGKTRLAELLITQDIYRGEVVIVFDPKGDADLLIRMYGAAKKAGRLDNFYCFHLGFPEFSARYNPVSSFTRITEVANRIAQSLPGEGQSAAFKDFVWRYVNVIAQAMSGLGRKVDYEMIREYGQNIEPLVRDYMSMLAEKHDPEGYQSKVQWIQEAFKDPDNKKYRIAREMSNRDHAVIALWHYCKEEEIFDSIASSLSRTFEYDRGYYDKLVSSLLPLMDKLTSGKVSELLSPDYLDQTDERPIFDWATVIRTKSIVYVGLDALTDGEVAGAVGNSMFADLTSLAGRKYKHGVNSGLPDSVDFEDTKVCIHADEFNELIGDEFIPMLNKAGGAGYQVTAYTQTWSDVEARLNNKAKAGQVAGNFNSMIMLRVRETATAEMFTEQLREVEIDHLMTVSGATDSSDIDNDLHFISKTEQRITTQQSKLIHPNDFVSLPKGQAFALLDGGKPYKIRLPLTDPADLVDLPSNLSAMSVEMRERYNSSEDWYQFVPSFDESAIRHSLKAHHSMGAE
ncbi:MAG: type IV conjugative transfer system coupling protein TraD [Gammaproteobacteria bacterium]|jgi:conjugative coupling factor TraD (TOL family)|nr:type IV conjugative transfer system coupling protein TraD [Gammaproteobacteria bacterium]